MGICWTPSGAIHIIIILAVGIIVCAWGGWKK